MIYRSWELECDWLKLLIMGQFLPFYAKNLKNQNFEKMKKTAGDVILHMCTKSHNHMRYGFWDRARQTDFFVPFGHFLPF